MKKRLITLRTTLLAILAIFAILLVTINPASAATVSSVRIVLNEGASSSGYFVLNVAPTDTVIVDLYATAPRTGVQTRINQRAVTYDGPVDELVLGNTFSGLAVGTTVYACLVKNNIPDCVTYVVPGTNTIPDTDKDGVADNIDLCSGTPPGVVVDASGCPLPVDTDKDGVNDDVDNCDSEAGPAGNGGCPVVVPEPVDTDKDGVTDDKDKCADVAGPASNNGCPVDVSPKKAAVCKYVGKPGVDERLQTGQNPIVVDRKDWMVIGSPFQDAHGRSIVIAFLNPQDPEPSVDQCPVLVVDVCPDMVGNQPAGTDCNPVIPPVDVCPEEGVQPPGTDCESEVPTTCPPGMGWKDANDNGKVDEGECHKRTGPIAGPVVDVCPDMVGDQPAGTDCNPVVPPVTEEPTPDTSSDDPTNGRGFRVQTAATEVPANANSEVQIGQGMLSLAALMVLATAVAVRRRHLSMSE